MNLLKNKMIYNQNFENEWKAILRDIDPQCFGSVRNVAEKYAEVLSSKFYTTMMEDSEATEFLDHSIVEKQLSGALRNWIVSVFSITDPADVAACVALQLQVGERHARIKIPVAVIGRSIRHLKRWICAYLPIEGDLDAQRLIAAFTYVHEVVDLAFEIMTISYISSSDRATRADEGYRLFSLTQDLALERERQRAFIAEWLHLLIRHTYQHPDRPADLLRNSEFGMWLRHKGAFIFEQASELPLIDQIAERIDTQLVPQLSGSTDYERRAKLLENVEDAVSELKFLLASTFERHIEIENGRDTLTKLLNRRFLASALSREIDMAKRGKHAFSIALIDIDHFKKVNDAYGHDSGDSVLQQAAALILNNTRAGDFVFRFGGEELLVLFVDKSADHAVAAAEKLRGVIERATMLLSSGRSITVTVSIGVASFDGHPDYKHLLSRADAALYEAKRLGRNRCVLAEPVAA